MRWSRRGAKKALSAATVRTARVCLVRLGPVLVGLLLAAATLAAQTPAECTLDFRAGIAMSASESSVPRFLTANRFDPFGKGIGGGLGLLCPWRGRLGLGGELAIESFDGPALSHLLVGPSLRLTGASRNVGDVGVTLKAYGGWTFSSFTGNTLAILINGDFLDLESSGPAGSLTIRLDLRVGRDFEVFFETGSRVSLLNRKIIRDSEIVGRPVEPVFTFPILLGIGLVL